MRILAVLLLIVLAACGIDGPPVPPSEAEEEARRNGVTISGTVEVGISGTL